MNTKSITSTAREFILEFFLDCDGAMLVKNKKEGVLEILVFYNLIQAQYQKDFQYHNWKINTTIYRTSNCYALIVPIGKNRMLVKMFSNATIIKDNKHELETIQSEARIILERDQIYK